MNPLQTIEDIRHLVGPNGENTAPTAKTLIEIMLTAMLKGGIRVNDLRVHGGRDGYDIELSVSFVEPSRIIHA